MVGITSAATEEAMNIWHIFRKIFGRKKAPPVYTTRAIEGPRADGRWVAELSRDGIPCIQINVGSISALIARSR